MGKQKLTEQEEKMLVDEYMSGIPAKILMNKYGFKTKKSIQDKVIKYGRGNELKNRRDIKKPYYINLEKIDSEFNAYFIGLMMTDGYVKKGRTDFGINLIDEDCIKFIADSTNNTYHFYNNENSGRYRILFSSKEQINFLKRYNIVPNKTFNIKGFDFLPEEEKYIPYVIRGIIDGDGCIGKLQHGTPYFSIVSQSKDFAYWIKYLLENKLYMKDIKIYCNQNGLYEITSAKLDNLNILQVVVYDKPYGMKRKYKKLKETFRDYNKSIFDIEDEGIVQTATETA